jgi:hypothetical protein
MGRTRGGILLHGRRVVRSSTCHPAVRDRGVLRDSLEFPGVFESMTLLECGDDVVCFACVCADGVGDRVW